MEMMKKKYAKPGSTEVKIKMGQILTISTTNEVLSPEFKGNISDIEESDPEKGE